jgi:DNA-binding NtrC family response regulator
MMDNKKILVVDDEEAICRLMELVFDNTGHTVLAVYNGADAVGAVKKEHFDIVFLDIIMKGINGLETMEEIKKISPETQVVIITGNITDNVITEKAIKGADWLFYKPFDIKNIIDYVEKL